VISYLLFKSEACWFPALRCGACRKKTEMIVCASTHTARLVVVHENQIVEQSKSCQVAVSFEHNLGPSNPNSYKYRRHSITKSFFKNLSYFRLSNLCYSLITLRVRESPLRSWSVWNLNTQFEVTSMNEEFTWLGLRFKRKNLTTGCALCTKETALNFDSR